MQHSFTMIPAIHYATDRASVGALKILMARLITAILSSSYKTYRD